ncbi:MAG: Glucose-6-phosphate isomerase [Firmicutes bacterium]|nr:Glucose-6-phosphate isomerase [candidate division NPL-UPA2 bacterium]
MGEAVGEARGGFGVDLRAVSGLPLSLGECGLVFGEGLSEVEPACRRLSDARYAFAADDAGGIEELYFMYRDVGMCEHRSVMRDLGLRYDVTVIMPGVVGGEFNKTVGHYHPVKAGTGMTYPEVYEVLHGEATYLMQRQAAFRKRPATSDGGRATSDIDDAYVVVARPGDKVVIPPGYGHVTINAGGEVLVMANWVASEFESVYGEYRALRGGAYYLFKRGDGREWAVNPNYAQVAPLRFVQATDYPEFGLVKGVPMYMLIATAPEKLRWLTHPKEHK